MRGHAPIIRMRLAGRRPKIVFVNDFRCETSKDWHDPGASIGQHFAPDHATVQIDPTDNIALLDLRWIAGMTASVTGSTEARAKALHKACINAGAAVVASTHAQIDEHHRVVSGWTEIYRKETEVAHA